MLNSRRSRTEKMPKRRKRGGRETDTVKRGASAVEAEAVIELEIEVAVGKESLTKNPPQPTNMEEMRNPELGSIQCSEFDVSIRNSKTENTTKRRYIAHFCCFRSNEIHSICQILL